MNTSDGFDEVVKEIAATHGIALSKEDPIMIMHTLNKRLIEDSKSTQQDLLDNFRSQMEVLYSQWTIEAKHHSDRILNASIVSGKAEVARVMEAQSRVIIEQWKHELNAGFSQVHQALQAAKQTAVLNVIAALITSASAVIVLYIFLTM